MFPHISTLKWCGKILSFHFFVSTKITIFLYPKYPADIILRRIACVVFPNLSKGEGGSDFSTGYRVFPIVSQIKILVQIKRTPGPPPFSGKGEGAPGRSLYLSQHFQGGRGEGGKIERTKIVKIER